MEHTIDPAFTLGNNEKPRYAGFGRRLGANLLDFLILIPLGGAASYYTTASPNFQVYLILTLLVILYKPVTEAVFGATLGKKILKLKVLTEQGYNIGFGHALLRAIPWLISGLVSVYIVYLMFSIPGYTDVEGYLDSQEFMMDAFKNGDWNSSYSILQSLVGFLPLVSALLIFANKRNQAAHDILGQTIVVHTESAIPTL